MASTRDIRRRIKSVKNTRQITKAMELVAASKMKKAQQAALASQPYAQLMGRMLAVLANRVEEASHPFLEVRPVKTRGILLVTTDKGLAGPLNANLFKLVSEIKSPAKYYAIGRKGAQFLARTHRDMVAASLKSEVPRVEDPREIVFEPDPATVLEALLPFYVNRQIFKLVLSAKASEHSARMVAMKTAKDNATKLLGDLTLEYNKARQAGITQEILEIAAAQFVST